ncbi:MAG: hypothetical protein KHY89_04865 [Butyricicoccus pullicaecorum]|nr:hypothetical protein [Butyricicoccus pullicaecorum]
MVHVSKRIAGVLGISGLLVLCTYLYWKPIPIVPDPKLGAVDIVKVRNAEGELVLLEEYDEACCILNYLATCKERRILEDVGAYSLDDADVMLLVFTGDSLKQVVLGDVNYVSSGKSNKRKHEILDADDVRQNLFALLQ